ncbi:hypothetical protein CCO03_04930 [Comamonas serinivorans]|uniref:Zinc-dependent peptidase n=2 Tax=Comamonas serinivorans TaxID=1082851 RepID=A0A1Y0ETG1_9BURK|nr:hypothetical protein CCO03_04930 [Comamonas serinivorans]
MAEARGLSAERWRRVVAPMRFITALPDEEQARLRRLSAAFLAAKEFHGLAGLHVTDDMAIAVAAQACLPLLHLGPAHAPEQALRWYASFVGILIAPHEVPVQRRWEDDSGVVHEGWDVVSGEVSDDGPVLLSWLDVQLGMGVAMPGAVDVVSAGNPLAARDDAGLPAMASSEAWSEAGRRPDTPYNVVIHEFCHKIDMASGEADGCPPLPAGFMGHARVAEARAHWLAQLTAAFEQHAEQVAAAERFGQPAPWLDAYGAESLAEFFPVACEAYFTERERFAREWPALLSLFDALFRPVQG